MFVPEVFGISILAIFFFLMILGLADPTDISSFIFPF